MFLYLHVTSSPSEDSAKQTDFIDSLSFTLHYYFATHPPDSLYSPHFMVRIFELDLLKRVFPQKHLPSDNTDLDILNCMPSDFFRDDSFALCADSSDEEEEESDEDDADCENVLYFDPFPGQGDEETPTTFSLFEEKYLALDNIPAHLKRVGGLKEFIPSLREAILPGPNSAAPMFRWAVKRAKVVEDNFSVLMFLYLHVTSSPSEDSTKKTDFIDIVGATVHYYFSTHSAPYIRSPHFMVRIFELDLLKRVRSFMGVKPLDDYRKDLVILDAMPSEFFRDKHFALCAECMLPICLICEGIIKSSTHPGTLAVAIHSLYSQRAIRYSKEATFGGNAELDELFHRMTANIFPLFIESEKFVRRNAKTYLCAPVQLKIQDPLAALEVRINNIRWSALTDEDIVNLTVGGKVLQVCRTSQKTMDWRINQALDIIERLKDSPLALSYFIFIRKCIQFRQGSFQEEATMRRLLPVLFKNAMLPEHKVSSLLSITTKRVIKLGVGYFDLSVLPTELRDRVEATFLIEYLRSKQSCTDEEVTVRTLAKASIQSICSPRAGVPRNATGLILEMLLAGFADNPDSRTHQSLLLLAGAIGKRFHFSYASDFAEPLNSLLIHICNALEDPSDVVKEAACEAIGIYYLKKDNLELTIPISLEELLSIFFKLAWEVESETLSIAAFSTLNQLVERVNGIPELMKPNFVDILRRSEDAIPKSEFKGDRLLAMIDLVDGLLTTELLERDSCPPHQVSSLLVNQLEGCLGKLGTGDDDEKLWEYAETLVLCIANMQGSLMEELKSRLVPLCHQVTAWLLKQPTIDSDLDSAILDILSNFFGLDSSTKDESLLNEDYNELILHGLKEPTIFYSVFSFLAAAWTTDYTAVFLPIKDKCFDVICSNLAQSGEPSVVSAAYSALWQAFRKYEFTQEQIDSFFARVHVEDFGLPGIECDRIGTAVAMCGIRHARFMCDIDSTLLRCLITMQRYQPPPTAEDNERQQQQFFLGACNIWEALLKSNRLKDNPELADDLWTVLDTLRGWSVDVLPRVGLVVEEMNQALQSESTSQ